MGTEAATAALRAEDAKATGAEPRPEAVEAPAAPVGVDAEAQTGPPRGLVPLLVLLAMEERGVMDPRTVTMRDRHFRLAAELRVVQLREEETRTRREVRWREQASARRHQEVRSLARERTPRPALRSSWGVSGAARWETRK